MTRFRNVSMLGELAAPATREEFRRASIYAAPAFYEPFGLAVLEAALSDCALVLADIPSFREIWPDAAVFVDPSDAGAWRKKLNVFIEDAGARDLLVSRARSRARKLTVDARIQNSLRIHGR